MRWTCTLLFNDAALPCTDESGVYFSSVLDCSNYNFDQLVALGYDAVAATLEDRVNLDDITIDLIASERFENQSWAHGVVSPSADAWHRALDATLPSYLNTPASSLSLQLAAGPGALAQLEQRWVDAARDALNTPSGVQFALQLLDGVQSLRRNLIPGTRCFSEYDNQPAVYDCRRVMAPRANHTAGRLMLIEMTIRE